MAGYLTDQSQMPMLTGGTPPQQAPAIPGPVNLDPYAPVQGHHMTPKQAMWGDLFVNVANAIEAKPPTSPNQKAMQQQALVQHQQKQQQYQAQEERRRWEAEQGLKREEIAARLSPKATRPTDLPTTVQEVQWLQDPSRTQEEIDQFWVAKRDPKTIKVGDVTVRLDPLDPNKVYVPGADGTEEVQSLQDFITKNAAEKAGAVTLEEKYAARDVAFDELVVDKMPTLMGSIDRITALKEAFESGAFDETTGPVAGRLSPFLTEEGAFLEAGAVADVLEALQIVNLAPVTENELALLRKMVASPEKATAANLGTLRSMIERAERGLEKLQDQDDYFQTKGSIRGYRPNWRDKLETELESF